MSNSSLDDLGGFTPVIDEATGKITGYKTKIGGADTVFPFSSEVTAQGYSSSVTETTTLQNAGSNRSSIYTVPKDCKYVIVSMSINATSSSRSKPYSKITSGIGTFLGGGCDWNVWNSILTTMVYKDVKASTQITLNGYGQSTVILIY